MGGIIGVLSLAVIATMVYQNVRAGSQGPAEAKAVLGGVNGIYNTLMK